MSQPPPEDSNPSPRRLLLARRQLLHGGLALALGTLLGQRNAAASAGPLLGFSSVPPIRADRVTVPPGYVAEVLAPWGDPVGIPGAMPAFRPDAGNPAAEQAVQLGMHHDGLQFFPLPDGPGGLLVINHEYTDDGLLHPDGMQPWTADKVRKAQAAHGISVIHVEPSPSGGWHVVRPSPWARRITATTPVAVAGPAAGHPLLRTADDPHGRHVLGTLNNCGCDRTPWGTYLACEENFAFYFEGPPQPDAHQRRWGLKPGSGWLRWHEYDERFDLARHPNEANRFGWVVEFDPFDPQSVPVKRTALGRAAHEAATVALTRDGRAVVYSGEDARFEYIYKFVSRDRMAPGGARANAMLLDHGTLYVARFDADGTGRWLPLVHGQGPLQPTRGFADPGEVLVKSRQAGDALGATPMDRPEWITVAPDGRVYCSLSNNARRGTTGTQPIDAANPRPANAMGHIIRWQEDGDFDADRFRWDHFVLAGDPDASAPNLRGTMQGDAFACPDGLWADPRGVLWIQTDIAAAAMETPAMARLGNNAMLAADPSTGEVRRFLVGPPGCELTGIAMTPDLRTLFVNIQHPGEPAEERSDPSRPRAVSNWPDFDPQGRPRSATVVIRRQDGGVIGS